MVSLLPGSHSPKSVNHYQPEAQTDTPEAKYCWPLALTFTALTLVDPELVCSLPLPGHPSC